MFIFLSLSYPYAFSQSNNSTASNNGGGDLTQLFNTVKDSVVKINTITQDGNSFQGSGFIYDNDGHVVTNAHVLIGAKTITVTFPNENSYSVQIIGEDPYSDLAVLQPDPSVLNQEQIKPLPTGNSSAIQVGQEVVAIGSPSGLATSFSQGIISQTNRVIDGIVPFLPETGLIQHNAFVYHGSSGGPLLNLQGEVIGVNAYPALDIDLPGMGLAIPSNTIQKVVPQLISQGNYKHPYLGISYVNGSMASQVLQYFGLPINYGAIVPSVASGSPADAAGIRGISQNQTTGQYMLDNIIKGIDGVTVKSSDDLFNYLNSKSAGDTVTLQVIGRDGVIRDTSATLTEMPTTFENSLTSTNTTSTNSAGNVTLTQNSASNGASVVGWHSYTNSTYGISLLYPPNWILTAVSQPSGTNNTAFDIMHFSPPISQDPAADTTFGVGIDNSTRKVTPSLDQYTYDTINNYRSAANVTDFKVIKADTNVTIAGHPGYLLYYTRQLRSDQSPRTYLEVGTIAGGKIYYLSINSDLLDQQFRNVLLPQVVQMIKSFKIVSPNTSSVSTSSSSPSSPSSTTETIRNTSSSLDQRYNVKLNDTVYPIDYHITAGKIENITFDTTGTPSLNIYMSEGSHGVLTIKIPRELLDNKKEGTNIDEGFSVLSGSQSEITNDSKQRTLAIEFDTCYVNESCLPITIEGNKALNGNLRPTTTSPPSSSPQR